LLKPFSKEDLAEAIQHYQQKQNKKQSAQQFDALFHNLKHFQKDLKKITLPTSSGLTVYPVKEIIRCQAEINYTNFYLTSKSKMLVTKTLKEYEELLNDYDFMRVHNSHLINLHHVKNYSRGEGGSVTMSDGTTVDVSRRKKDEFLKRLETL
jgi:two-component system LytT family response regulator